MAQNCDQQPPLPPSSASGLFFFPAEKIQMDDGQITYENRTLIRKSAANISSSQPRIYSNQPKKLVHHLKIRLIGSQNTVFSNQSRMPNNKYCEHQPNRTRTWLITNSFPNFFFQCRSNQRKSKCTTKHLYRLPHSCLAGPPTCQQPLSKGTLFSALKLSYSSAFQFLSKCKWWRLTPLLQQAVNK